MKRLWILAALSVLLVAVLGTAAQAANPHFVEGYDPPTCSIDGTTVSCTGTQIAGVGNYDAIATLAVTASGIVDCNNPGENPNNPIESHEATFAFSTDSGVLEPKNGRLVVPPLSATAPTSLTAEQESALCPNPNWEADLREGSVVITSWTYTIDFLTRAGTVNFYSVTGP